MQFVRFIKLLLFLLFLNVPTLAQRIGGTVRDTKNVPVPFATVALLRPDSTLLTGTLADAEGRYELADIQPGTYRLAASMVGFQPAKAIAITMGTLPLAHDFVLAEAVTTLGEVQVRAARPFLEVSADRTVLNVEGSIVAAGTMASDVLRRAPGVTIDNQGNISLKGKANVLVLLDGKPTLLDQKQLAALLRTMPSNQLSQIEVMTNPPARYDAQGNAGIINIRLKRNKAYGTNGTLTLSQGQGRYYKTNAGLGLNHRTNRWNLFGNYDFAPNQDYNEYRQTRAQPPGPDPVQRLLTWQDYIVPATSHTAKAGAELTLGERTSLDLTGTGQWSEERYLGTNRTEGYDAAGLLQQRTQTRDLNPDRYTNRSARLGFRHAFSTDTTADSKPHELTTYADLAHYGQRSTQDATYLFLDGSDRQTTRERLLSQTNSLTDILVAATDYTRPLSTSGSFEAGLKLTTIRVGSGVQVQTQTSAEPLADRPERNSDFAYDEQIQAAYVSSTYQHEVWQFKAGLRLENWRARGTQRLTGNSFRRDSLFLFPSASVQYKLSESHALALSFGRRIDRPAYDALNPITYFTDPFTIFVGNPALRPQLTNNLELTHTWQDGLLVTTLNYSHTDDFMAEYVPTPLAVDGPVQALTTQNIARFTNFGLAASLNVPVTKWLTTQTFVNGFRNRFAGTYAGATLNNSSWAWQLNMTNQIKLPRQWAIEVVGSYESGRANALERLRALGMLTLGVARPIWHEAGTMRLAVQDVFRTYRFADETRIGTINQSGSYRWDNRIVTLSLTWRFGKTTLAAPREQASADERAGGGRR
jgi:iron complex outermembrane recepter protein